MIGLNYRFSISGRLKMLVYVGMHTPDSGQPPHCRKFDSEKDDARGNISKIRVNTGIKWSFWRHLKQSWLHPF